MLDELRDVLGFELTELAGTHVSGELPLRQDLLNRLIAAQLAARPSPVAAVLLDIRDANLIVVRVRPRNGWVPPLLVEATIDRQPDLPASPVVGIRWSLVGLGALARFASPVLALLNVLPPGIRIEGDRAEVNLDTLLQQQGHADALRFVRSLEITTEPERILVRFAARV